MFEKSTRLKLRFNSPKGLLTGEDIYSLPLLTNSPTQIDLNTVAQIAFDELAALSTKIFVGAAANSTKRELAQLRLDIIKHVIDVKEAEAVANEQAKVRASQKERINELIAEKQLDGMKSKSLDELNALLAAL